jgi:hypothetical protein
MRDKSREKEGCIAPPSPSLATLQFGKGNYVSPPALRTWQHLPGSYERDKVFFKGPRALFSLHQSQFLKNLGVGLAASNEIVC